jgi:hypothetical protein
VHVELPVFRLARYLLADPVRQRDVDVGPGQFDFCQDNALQHAFIDIHLPGETSVGNDVAALPEDVLAAM